MAAMMNEETSDSSENDVKSDDVLSTQSLLVAAVTKRATSHKESAASSFQKGQRIP